MSPHPAISLFITVAISAFAFAADEKNTVPGPESDKLRPLTTGYLLIDRSSREIIAIELPSLKETIIRPTRPADQTDDPTIHALSGPDAQGRIAYVEDHFFVAKEDQRRHLLKTIRLDGTGESVLFSRPGDAMWAMNGEIGKVLSLSPVGGRIAFLSALKSAQMPRALLKEGSIEIWDLEKKTGGKTHIKAIDDGLAWFPDGKRLAFVKLAKPDDASKDQQKEFFGATYSGWDRVPTVFVRDIVSDEESFVAVGWSPVVSPDGRSVLVTNANMTSYRRIDLDPRKITSVNWPGAWGEPIAWPAPDISLSWCLPTQGAQIRYTQNNSPLVGPKPMLTLKLSRFNTGEFQTLVPYIDPRNKVSFGILNAK